MDMRELRVGQRVTLSGALPGGGISGVVKEVAKHHVTVTVAARIEGEDGDYCVHFDYDGNVTMFYDWVDASMPGWDWASPCPIPDLKIILKEEETQ
jgi:hypothetical protein